MILNAFQVRVSSELIRLSLVKHKYTRKRARYYSQPSNDLEQLNEFLLKRKQFVDEQRNFVSIDETSFGRNYQPAFGYAKRGKRLNIKRTNTRITTTSVVSAITGDGKIYYKQESGSFNANKFVQFLESLPCDPKYVLLMDNVAFHHSQVVLEYVKERQWDVLFTPPYSPIFNPIEGVFSIVKRSFQKHQSIAASFESVTDKHIQGFFKHSFGAVKRLDD